MKNRAEITFTTVLIIAAISFALALIIPEKPNLTGFSIASGPAGDSFTNCSNIYNNSVLTQDIQVNFSDNSSSSTCFTFQTSNIVLDCQGYTITGNGNGFGTFLAGSSGTLVNQTLKNCKFNNFYTGIMVQSNNSFVINNTITNYTENGIIMGSSYFSTQFNFVANNTIIGYVPGSLNPIYSVNLYNSTIINNHAYNCSNASGTAGGVYNFYNSSYNRIISNLAYDNSGGFVLGYNSDHNYLYNNTVQNNQAVNGEAYEIVYKSRDNIINQSFYIGNQTNVQLRVGQSTTDTSQVTVIDSAFGRYWFRNASFTYINSSAGEITFLDPLTVEPPGFPYTNLSKEIKISNNRIFVNSSVWSGVLNKSANLTFYHVYRYDPNSLWDTTDSNTFTNCPPSVCTDLTYNRTTQKYTFNVTRFTTYSTNESNLTCPLIFDFNYNFTKNAIGNTTCIIINASNLDIDCQGHTITGTQSGYGVEINNFNNTLIQNCFITNFSRAIQLSSAHSNNLTNNTIYKNIEGLGLASSTNNKITSNNISNTTTLAVQFFSNSHNNFILDNNIYGASTGLDLTSSTAATVNNNIISSVTGNAVALGAMTNSNLSHNTITNAQRGFSITGSTNIVLTNNTATTSSASDIFLSSTTQTQIINSIFNIFNFTNAKPIIINTPAGQLSYFNGLNASGTNFNQKIQIKNNSIYVNSTQSGLNTTANLTFYNITYSIPKAKYSPWDNSTFIGCPSTICQNIQTLGPHTQYTTTQFTTYSTKGNSYPSAVTLIAPPNNSNLTDTTLTFNWTNSTDPDADPVTFYLQISTSPSFSSLTVNQSTTNLYHTLAAPLADNYYYWRVKSCDFDVCNQSAARIFLVDTANPSSIITTLTNNSDIGKNNFPINISGTASDNLNLSKITVYINTTSYTATGTTNWNLSWTPSNDGEYQIYSKATDFAGNNETQFETYTIEVYTTSNLTNTTKVNSRNLDSDILHSVETNSLINISYIDRSEFVNMTPSYNCVITRSNLNYSQCYNSVLTDCHGENWYVNPSNLTNVTGSNNNITNSNVSHSTVDNSNVSDSEVTTSDIDGSSIVNGSQITNSDITNSHVDYSNITGSDIDDSTVDNSNITNSTVDNSNITDSAVEDSTVTDSNVSDSTITDSNVTGSTITNSTITNSTITDMVVNNTIIDNDQCTNGTIYYQGNNYTCPIALSSIYSPPPPPPPSPGGGGGGKKSYQCSDGLDNDNDGKIDYPQDPGCLRRTDNDESEVSCRQSWTCTSWSDCINNTQTRICSEESKCQEKLDAGAVESITEVEKPSEQKDCEIEDKEIIPAIECVTDPDCPAEHTCEDYKCIPFEIREPTPPTPTLSQRLKDFFTQVKKIFDYLFNINKQIWNLIKVNYSPILITILVVAVIIAGFFAYRSFMASGRLEEIKQWQVQRQKIRQKKLKIKKKEIKKLQKQKIKKPEISKKTELKQIKKLDQTSEELSYFIRDSFFHGYNANQIKKALSAKGWPNKIVEKYLKKIKTQSQAEIEEVKKQKKIQKEKQRLSQALKNPKQGIPFYEKPKIIKPAPPPIKPFEFKPPPVKKSLILEKELTQLEKEIQNPAIPQYQKPTVTKTIPQKTLTTSEKIKQDISELARQNKSKQEIIQTLKSKWPEKTIKKIIDKYYPHLKNVSYFKKEVAELEQELNKLKQR